MPHDFNYMQLRTQKKFPLEKISELSLKNRFNQDSMMEIWNQFYLLKQSSRLNFCVANCNKKYNWECVEPKKSATSEIKLNSFSKILKPDKS